MINKRHTKNRLTSIFLVIAILLSTIYIMPLASSAAGVKSNRVADPSTMDGWKEFFPITGDISTENAGGVWMDKSVFTDASAFAGLGITKDRQDSFLVALSAIAANMAVTGVANAPTDTVIILDLSSSMYNGSERNPDTVQTMLNSVNQTIAELQELNVNNRVGVVVYYGGVDRNQSDNSNSMVLLPLDRYSGTNTYLKANLKSGDLVSVAVNSNVKNSAGKIMPQTTRVVTDVAGTYAQLGLLDAMDQLLNADTVVPATADYQPGVARTPIVVFMSDGEPTAATHEFTKKVNAGMGNNTISIRSANETDFVTQLTAAYVKEMVDLHYEQMDALFYSLSLGTSVSLAVMDPANNTPDAIDDYWDALLKNGSVNLTVYNSPNGWSSPSVEKKYTVSTASVNNATFPSKKSQRNYVDKAFTASTANQLSGAFNNIVRQIDLVSKYMPTLVSGNADLSGYISFVDRIGEYMSVTDIKGVLIDNHLFSGADLASNFVPSGGALGTYENPTALGMEMVAAVRTRLGLDSDDTARTLIALAYENGQLSYTDANNYSNYIGWYANEKGEFLGFYNEGTTDLSGDPDAMFIIRSYGYLGEVDESHGVSESDMMYATVQVRKNIKTGEEIVTFAIPAALIPIVSYNVTLDENGELTALSAGGADNPIRLVYEVALDDHINSFNIKEIVSDEYLADEHNVNDDGTINFYTNMWEHENTTGYGTVNTYSYFNPSRENDKYYYLEDAPVYSDNQGTLYIGNDQPDAEGTFYRSYKVYRNNGSLSTETIYRPLSVAAKGTALPRGDGSWYIPKGNVHVNLDGYTLQKSKNETGTLDQSNIPFVDTANHAINEEGYNFFVGATLGNNGKLTVLPETGIKLTKTMAEGATEPTEAFAFNIDNITNSDDNSTYPAWLVKEDGTDEDINIVLEGGHATVYLNAGETLYIGGMTAGDTFRISEAETAEYIATAIGLSDTGTVTVDQYEIQSVSFVNDDRGAGNLTIAKEVEHDFGQEYQIPADKMFTMQVTLEGVGTDNATFTAEHSGDSSVQSIHTNDNGQFTVTLKHDEQLEVFGIPAGTTVTVVELDPDTGFTPAYWDNGQLGDGQVTIQDANTVSVIVVNDYEATEVYPVNITVGGRKILQNQNWQQNYSFDFKLQKYLGDGNWQDLGTATASYGATTFTFADAFANERYTKAGSYYYRVIEIEPQDPLGGFTYDKTVHSFSVIVGDADMDGQLEITDVVASRPNTTVVTITTDGWNVDTEFTNIYSITGNATVTIDLNKMITNIGGAEKSLAGYTFGLYDGNTLAYTSAATTERGFARLVLTYTVPGIYQYTLKEIVPATVPAGWTYSTLEIPVTVVVSDDGDGTISAIIYTGTEQPANAETSIEATFTNIYDPADTELAIDFVNKQLSGRELNDKEFTFEVQTQNGSTVLEGTNNKDGKVTFNGTLQFDKAGIYFYNIVETSADGNGVVTDKTTYRVTVTVTDTNGSLSASYVIVNATGNTITFQNSYTVTSVEHSIVGNKVLHGRKLINDEFSFVLTEQSYNGSAIQNPRSWTVKNLAGDTNNIVFPTITYDNAGTYVYTVKEIIPEGGIAYGILYDSREYTVTIVIEDNGVGALVVSSETVSGADTTLTFENEYKANPTFVQFAGEKQLTGKVDNALSGGEYEFELYNSDADWERGTLRESVANDVDGVITFTKIDFDTVGDQYFLVVEKNGGQTMDGVTYDDTVYRVWVEITDDQKGQLHATIHIYDGEGIPQDKISFVNVYEITGGATVTLSGEKTIDGRDFKEDDSFFFELYEADENYNIGKTPKTTVAMDLDTYGYEICLDFTAADVGKTFYYVVAEKDAGKTIGGITYSSTQYQIKIEVKDNGIGGIETTVTVESATTSTLNFVNKYTAESATITIGGNKELDGRDLVEGEFKFLLYEADEVFGIPAGTSAIIAFNDANGVFSFETITFTEAGTYNFVIMEDDTVAADRMIFDTTVYYVTIEVIDDTNGKLIASDPVILKQGGTDTVDAIQFANVYVPKPADITVPIDILKTVVNIDAESIGPEGFRFLLKSDQDGDDGIIVMTDEQGMAQFTLTFTEDDIGKTFFYTLTEINDGREYVIYSTDEYKITISVALDEETNTLVATYTQDDVETESLSASFENIYDPDGGAQTGDETITHIVIILTGICVLVSLYVYSQKRRWFRV